MKRKLIAALLSCWFVGAFLLHAQSLDQEISRLADRLSKALIEKGCKNVAAVDFTDLQGQPTELGRFLAEQLTIEIVATAGVSMLDRANIKSILAEHKLTEEGLVNPANAKKLGEFAGLDAILIGNATALDDGIVLMVKAISTATAQIVAAGRIKFSKTSEIQQLLNRSVSAISGGPGLGPGGSVANNRGVVNYQEATAIATKDLGSLRVVLKSVTPIKSIRGQRKGGIRCTFEFINRETQRVIVVAMNADPSKVYSSDSGSFDAIEVIRSSVLDERGGVWKLYGPSLAGLSTVRAGQVGYGATYPSSAIVRLLNMRETLNSDRDPSDPYRDANQFVHGSTSPLDPGQIIRITMDFIAEEVSSETPRSLQINTEIVIGIAASGSKKSHSLQNLTFDRVSVPSL